MPKLKNFLWQLCHVFLTRGTLLNIGLQIDPIRPLCNEEIEDVEHPFHRCRAPKEMWKHANGHDWVSFNVPCNNSHSLQS